MLLLKTPKFYKSCFLTVRLFPVCHSFAPASLSNDCWFEMSPLAIFIPSSSSLSSNHTELRLCWNVWLKCRVHNVTAHSERWECYPQEKIRFMVTGWVIWCFPYEKITSVSFQLTMLGQTKYAHFYIWLLSPRRQAQLANSKVLSQFSLCVYLKKLSLRVHNKVFRFYRILILSLSDNFWHKN